MTAPAHLIDLLHRGASGDAAVPMPDETALASTGERLDAFADTLSLDEQAVLGALVNLAVNADPYAALGRIPAEQILTSREHAYFEQIAAEPPPAAAGPRATVTAIMKATRLCNLRCTYCHSWRDGPNQVMSFPMLARTIRDLLRDPGVRHAEFV